MLSIQEFHCTTICFLYSPRQRGILIGSEYCPDLTPATCCGVPSRSAMSKTASKAALGEALDVLGITTTSFEADDTIEDQFRKVRKAFTKAALVGARSSTPAPRQSVAACSTWPPPPPPCRAPTRHRACRRGRACRQPASFTLRSPTPPQP